MEIKFVPFLYVVSLTISMLQGVYLALKLWVHKRKEKGVLKEGGLRMAIVVGWSLTVALLNAYNLGGVFVSYSQGFVRYRSLDPVFYEKVLQVLEVLFDSFQKSTMVLSVLLFFPVLVDINRYFGDEKPAVSFRKFIVVFSFVRVMFYPSLYILLRRSTGVALYFIDIFNTAESCFLIYMFLAMYAKYRKALGREHVLHRFRKIIFESRVQDLGFILIMLSLQLSIDSFYRFVIVVTTFMQQSMFKYLLLDYAYLVRLISLTLQLYSILKVCMAEGLLAYQEEGQERAPDSQQEKLHEPECGIDPKEYHYFTQPNQGSRYGINDGHFTLF